MALYYGDNYTGQRITKPQVKIPKGENAGRVRTMIERFTLVDATGLAALNAADEINGPVLPANSFIVDAKLFINKSVGATGIFDLGYRATVDEDGNTVAEDQNALVDGADAGGQAVLERATETSVGLYKRLAQETQIYSTCTEVMDDSVLDAVLVMEVNYVND